MSFPILHRLPARSWVIAGLVVLGLYDVAYVVHWALGPFVPRFGDFFGFWSFGRFGQRYGAAIYDPYALAAYQRSLDPRVNGIYPYPYPPTFLLALIPLGRLALPVAYLCWIAATFLLYLTATLGGNWRSRYGLALLVAPPTLLTIISGQNGLLTAALLAGGLRNLQRRPVCAGVLLGLLSYKPQFVLLLPVILLAGRHLQTALASVVTVLAAIAITSALLGWSIWPEWIAGFPAYQRLLASNQTSLDHLMPTILAGMHAIGMPSSIGAGIQLVALVAVAVLCWRAFMRGIDDRAIAMAMTGTLIVSPYVMIYDTPMLAAAVAMSWRSRLNGRGGIQIWETCLVGITFFCILGMVSASLPLLVPALIVALFVTFTCSDTPVRPS